MMSYDVRSLMNGKFTRHEIKGSVDECYSAFKKLVGDNELTCDDAFMAGYMLANPVLREQLMTNDKFIGYHSPHEEGLHFDKDTRY